jgi:3-hydroxy-9,10-secoandrosta-1,3,5(10)-triene-9,17-dione monooxygenase reductase component
VRESERFCINMLSAGQEDVSRLFATKKSQEEKFAEIDHHLVQGVPVIDNSSPTSSAASTRAARGAT